MISTAEILGDPAGSRGIYTTAVFLEEEVLTFVTH